MVVVRAVNSSTFCSVNLLLSQLGASWKCEWKTRPPDMKGRYVKYWRRNQGQKTN